MLEKGSLHKLIASEKEKYSILHDILYTVRQ
jgi:hypothetical protein